MLLKAPYNFIRHLIGLLKLVHCVQGLVYIGVGSVKLVLYILGVHYECVITKLYHVLCSIPADVPWVGTNFEQSLF